MTVPQTMLAAVTCGEERKAVIREIPVPEIEPKQILVEVRAAAGNPTDHKSITICPTTGNVIGCDFSGVVLKIGSGVPQGLFKEGDAIAGFVHGAAYPNGAFSQYLAANYDVMLPVPKNWSFEEAAQVGVAMYTASLCLYHVLKLPSILNPTTTPIDILVWGGASAVGQSTIQLARLGGLRVFTTASPANFELVRSLGANEVFDYRAADTPAKIKALTNGKLKYAVDCISEHGTGDQIEASIGDEGGETAIILRYKQKRADVKTSHVLAYFLFGKDLTTPAVIPCDMAQYEHRKEATEILTKALLSGKYKPTPIEILPHGLESVNEGLELSKAGKVRGKKLIYRISDTPQLK